MNNTFQFDDIQSIETPFYYYDLRLLKKTLAKLKKEAEKHSFHIHYALKANNNPRIIQIIQSYGFGADCVSGEEINVSLRNKFKATEIFFAGIGKTDEEIELGLSKDIGCFNVESLEELKIIGSLANIKHKKANVALRINPNLEAETHRYISTGLKENKFGISSHHLDEVLYVISQNENLNFRGIHFHIGSQITNLDIFRRLAQKVNEWNQWFFDRGYDLPILNLGGGLGVDYKDPDQNPIPDFQSFFNIFKEHLKPRKNQTVHFELGRSLVASSGSLISKVLYIKKGVNKNFAILDAGMTEFIRPALYQAKHKIEKIGTHKDTMLCETYDVVGPICESSDCFGENVLLPKLKRGDLMAIRSTGAYGEVMASRYNLRKQLSFCYKDE